MKHGNDGYGVALAGLLFVIGGCATRQESDPAQVGTPIGTRIALPQTVKALGDVTCEVYKASGNRDLEQFEIRCPGWERYAGLTWRGDIPRSTSSWEQTLISDSDLAKTVQADAVCGASEATRILNDQPALVRRCASNNGGFPYLLIVTGVANRAFVLWGPAHVAPLFESFILTSLQGSEQAVLPGSRSQMIALAEQAVAPGGRAIGLEDMGQFTTLDELSTLYNSAKNHQRALELAQRALEIHERINGVNQPSSGYLVARIAHELSRVQPGLPQAMFQRAETLVKNSSNRADWAELLVYQAWNALRWGDQAQAEQYARQSQELSQASGSGTSVRTAHSLIGVGDVYVALNQLNEAEAAYSQALKIYDSVRGGDYHWVGESHQRLADVYRRRQNFTQARAEAQAAIDLDRTLFGDSRALAEALITLARVERDAGQPRRALELWREARQMLLNDRATLAQLKVDDFNGYLELLFELAEGDAATDRAALIDEAFVISQLGQTPAAGRAITQVAARLAENDPAVRDTARALQDALKARQDAQYALGLEQSKPFAARNSTQEEALKTKLRATTEDYQRQEERLQAQFPRYGRLVTPTPLNAADVAKLLRRGEALFRVLPGERETWVFLVSTDGALRGSAVKLSARQLTATVARLRAGVDATAGTMPTFDLALAHQLYEQLLGPVEAGLVGVNHLIVAPAGPLLSLPPALLVRRLPVEPGDYRRTGWLVRDMAIHLLPSVVALEQFRQIAGSSRATLPFIGFGDPLFAAGKSNAASGGGVEAVTQGCQLDASTLSRLPQLPDTANELRTLARTLGAEQTRDVL